MLRLRSFPLVVSCLLFSIPALGATHVWTGGTDDHFSNAANWIGGSPAGDPSAEISFPASSRLTATNDLNGLTVQSIAFSAGGFTISGNAITLAANTTMTDTSQGVNEISSNIVLAGNISIVVSINNNQAPQSLTLSGAISGEGAVTLRGGGNLVYAGSQPNSYSGLTLVLFGGLRLQKAANITAVAGELDVEDDGVTNEKGRVAIVSDEQIANTSHVTIGRYGTFACSATETLGPLMLIRGAQLVTEVTTGGVTSSTGTVVLAGDIEIAGTAGGDIVARGTFLLDGIRTINAVAGVGQLIMTPGQKNSGSGIIVAGGTYSDGSFSTVANITATYDGPTTIQGGNVRIDAPQSAVDLQNGGFGGRCKSLTAERGTVNVPSYAGLLVYGDVKLSPSVVVAYDVGMNMTTNGTLDLGGAALRIDGAPDFQYGRTYKVIDNASSNPVIGTFANLPEGSILANRYKISYVGGDGNDVTVTDAGLVSAEMVITMSSSNPPPGTAIDFVANVYTSSQRVPTGAVTFAAGPIVLGTAPVSNGVAKLTAGDSLPPGQYTVTAVYSGDSFVRPASAAANLCVGGIAPTLTSIDPPTITAGVKATLTAHGSNFTSGSYINASVGLFGTTTFISPTELRVDYTPLASKSDYQLPVSAGTHYPCGDARSALMQLNVTGFTRPTPFTFVPPVVTVTGVTPGAMTFWLATFPSESIISYVDKIVNDADFDGTVALSNSTVPPYGVWLVADLSAHTIVSDNATHTAVSVSPFPPAPFLRDSSGHYTHIQFPASIYWPSLFGWARPGVGAWLKIASDASPINDEDGGQNQSVTFETSAMQPSDGTTASPPADGLQPGDMFLVTGDEGRLWWGDIVDSYLAASNGPGKLGFASASTALNANAGPAKVLIERTDATDGTVSVQYATADDTLVAGRNYLAQAGTATFGAGEIFKTVSIPLIDARAYDGGQGKFKLNLSNPTGASLRNSTADVVVFDNAPPPVLSLHPASNSIQEGDLGQVDVPITVVLTGATYLPVTVNTSWREGQNGLPNAGAVHFAPGETQKTFTASYTANTTPEPNRVIYVTLSNAQNATVSANSTTLTIVDDDSPTVPVLNLFPSATRVQEGNSGIRQIPVSVDVKGNIQAPVSVSYSWTENSAGGGAPHTGTLQFLPGQRERFFDVSYIANNTPEPDRTINVTLSNATDATIGIAQATITITDDDSVPPPSGVPSRRRSVHH